MANFTLGKRESESTKAQMEFAEDVEASRSSTNKDNDNHNMGRVSLTEEDVSLLFQYIYRIKFAAPRAIDPLKQAFWYSTDNQLLAE